MKRRLSSRPSTRVGIRQRPSQFATKLFVSLQTAFRNAPLLDQPKVYLLVTRDCDGELKTLDVAPMVERGQPVSA